MRGGGGRESNPPATAMAARPVLKTGGATGPLPPPGLHIQCFLIVAMQSGLMTSASLAAGELIRIERARTFAKDAGQRTGSMERR
jgi:hypothetical protein